MGEKNSTKTNRNRWSKRGDYVQRERSKTRTSFRKSFRHGEKKRPKIFVFQRFSFSFLKSLKRFNTLLTSNSLARSEIDNLRVERQRYEDLSQKSEKELRSLRDQLVECIERSVNAYDQR